MGYWEPVHGKDGTTGVGCIIPLPVSKMQVRDQQLLAFTETTTDAPFVYYTGAVWDKAGFITSQLQWFEYLEQFRQQLSGEGIIISVQN